MNLETADLASAPADHLLETAVLELRLVRSFIAVADEGHFARAAQRLNITQPALSRQMQQLEREVGTALFTRVGRAARLTMAGKIFLDHARRLLASADAAAVAARRAGEGVVGHLVVGFVSPATYTVVPTVFRAFRERAPDVALELRQLSSGAQAEALRDREIDVGLLHPPVEGAPLLGLRVVVDQPFVAVLPARHPLAGEQSIWPGALADEPFVIFPRRTGPGLYDTILGLCQGAGFSPRVVQEAEQMQTIVSLVAAEVGVALVPASIARSWRDGVAYLEVEATDARATLAACWRLDTENPAVATLLDLLPNVRVE
ncbi:MAG TPA: LysR family transcriptional regulator [Gemmatimonadaceae bacterium]|nr:LysR family transcriptional regulator [Gemmatimonadaceae bacterium]